MGGNSRNVVGSEMIVYVNKDTSVCIEKLTRKITLEDFRIAYAWRALYAFVANENVHKMSASCKGALFVHFRTIAIYIIVKWIGCLALGERVFPLPKTLEEQFTVINMDSEGYFLEQLLGKPVGSPFGTARKKSIDANRNVVPLVDKQGYLKVSIHGPDVLKPCAVPSEMWEEMMAELRSGPKLVLRNNIAPKLSSATVPVLYVYEKVKGMMKSVRRKGLYSVHLGPSVIQPSSSNR